MAFDPSCGPGTGLPNVRDDGELPTSHQAPAKPPFVFDSIYDATRCCQEGFLEYAKVPTIFTQEVEQLQQRFSTWAGFLGVFAASDVCLDRRLAYRPEVKQLFLSMLTVLQDNIERGMR